MDNNIKNFDVALCLDSSGMILTVATFADESMNEIAVEHLPFNENVHSGIISFRAKLGYKTDENTVFKYVPLLYTEQTKVAALDSEVLIQNDQYLVRYLVQAMQTEERGVDGRPLFEKDAATNFVYDFVRLPNGNISLTEIPHEVLSLTATSLAQTAIPEFDGEEFNKSVAEMQNQEFAVLPDFLQAVETQMRVFARFLSFENEDLFLKLSGDETLCFFSFSPQGYAFALYNKSFGFFSELGEVFDGNVQTVNLGERNGEFTEEEVRANLYLQAVNNFLNNEFYKRIVPEDENFEPLNVKNIFWVAEEGLDEPIGRILGEFANASDFPIEKCEVTRSEIIVRGLLYGGIDKQYVPPINLANDLLMQNEELDEIELIQYEKQVSSNRLVTLIFILIPVLICLGIIGGLQSVNMIRSARLEARKIQANSEITRLTPLLNARIEYEKTLSWYEDILRQIVALRQKQSFPLSFASELDRIYPETNEFYIKELKLLPGGAFQIQGIARSEQSVVDFMQSLEFSTDVDGKRHFTDLTVGFKQGSKLASGSGSKYGGDFSGDLSPGVSGFSINGIFPVASVIKVQPNSVNPTVPNTPAIDAKPLNPSPSNPSATPETPQIESQTQGNK